MDLQNGILHLHSDMDNEQIEGILPQIIENIDTIQKVTIDDESIVASSALFALLYAIKKEKENIEIPLFQSSNEITFMGNVTFN